MLFSLGHLLTSIPCGTCVEPQEDPDPRKYSTYLATRPPKFEEDAAHMLIDVLVEEHISPTKGFYLHIAHLGHASNVQAFRVSVT